MGIASVAPLCNTPPGEGYDCEYGLAKLFGEHTHGPVTSGWQRRMCNIKFKMRIRPPTHFGEDILMVKLCLSV